MPSGRDWNRNYVAGMRANPNQNTKDGNET